jgi:gliding motility-associated-like protein
LNGQNLATITPTIIIPGGSFSASPSGLIIDPVTGIITVSASTPGTYSISYGNFSCGCYNNVALTNTFAISIPALVTISNASVCAGNSVMLSVTASPSVDLSYSWSVPSSNSASLVISPSVSSTYTATITNSLGCKSFAVASVTVNALPTLTITGNNAVCPGQSLSLNASGALTYTWNIGSNSNIVTMIPTSNFVYSVSGSNSIGCIASTTVIALIKPLPVISINIPTVCLGDQSVLTITSNPSSGVNYTWMPSGSQSSSLLVQVFSSTTYTIFSNLDGCVKLDSIRVIVTNTVEPITKFTYNSPYCIDSQNPIPILSEGFASGGLFSGVSEISLNQSSGTVDLNNSLPGNYQITYSVDRVNCTVAGTSTALIVIDEALKLSISKDKKIIPGSSTTITASGGDTYTWTPDFYLSCSNCTSPIANPPSNTKYCVQSKRNSCLSTACVNIEVACKGEEELIIANAFTPNGDNKNDKFCLQGWDGCIKQFSVMIFDRWGEKVFESNDPAFCWDGTYKGTLLNAGVYVYAIDAHYEQDLTIVKKGNITLIR